MSQFQGFKRKPESADDEGNKRPRTGRFDSGLGDEGLGGENDTDGRDGLSHSPVVGVGGENDADGRAGLSHSPVVGVGGGGGRQGWRFPLSPSISVQSGRE